MSRRVKEQQTDGHYKNHPFFVENQNKKSHVKKLNESVFESNLLKNFPNGKMTKEIYRRRN